MWSSLLLVSLLRTAERDDQFSEALCFLSSHGHYEFVFCHPAVVICLDQVGVRHCISIKPAEEHDTVLMLALCFCPDCRQRMPDLSRSCLVPKLTLQNVFDRWELVLWDYTGPEACGCSTFVWIWGNQITGLSHSLTLIGCGWALATVEEILLQVTCPAAFLAEAMTKHELFSLLHLYSKHL